MLKHLDISTKIRLLAACQEHEAAAAVLGCGMYRPHPKQDMFHRHGDVKFRYLRTGNRFGKSDCGSAEDVAWALGERPWYPKDDPARYAGIPRRPTKGIILCTDWNKAEEVFTNETAGATQGKLWKWLPKDAFVHRDSLHGHIVRIVVKSVWGGESIIYIDTIAAFKLNNQRGESGWYDWIHVDEPIPEEMWNSFSRGLIDTDGSAWFTCTPLREPWINRFFLPNNRFKLDDDKPNFFGKQKVVIVGKSTDNPYISEQGIQTFVEGLNDRERAARLFGRPIDSTGMVHPDFAEESHVYFDPPPGWKDVNTPPLDYTIRYHIDPHPVTPNAVLFSATGPDGRVWFFNEIYEPCGAKELAERVVEITKNYFVAGEWMDPSGFITNMVDRTTFADDLIQYGLAPEKGSKDLKRGIMLTNDMLKRPGQLNFAYNLLRTRYEFDNYVYDDFERKPDQPRDKDDHMMESLHRLVIGGLSYIPLQIFEQNYQENENYLLAV